jgi:hypothetical protein
VLCHVRFAGNFGIKARIIDDRKLVRIGYQLSNHLLIFEREGDILHAHHPSSYGIALLFFIC